MKPTNAAAEQVPLAMINGWSELFPLATLGRLRPSRRTADTFRRAKEMGQTRGAVSPGPTCSGRLTAP